ncbi:hypothetical protein EUTSA_v10000303mg [Eutrema salsugineum]|uniref:Arabinogalactan protein n=2 Tax=Eutrema salsugineum TaxID=72664 RepID=V4NIS0_EUTSA|nr:hypothetical protein EUTSA_v10000303mg [Eutrema salsugineum]
MIDPMSQAEEQIMQIYTRGRALCIRLVLLHVDDSSRKLQNPKHGKSRKKNINKLISNRHCQAKPCCINNPSSLIIQHHQTKNKSLKIKTEFQVSERKETKKQRINLKMSPKTLQVVIFLGFLATSCLSQAPAPAPTTVSPPTVLPPVKAESPSPVASPPAPVNEPTPAPTTAPTTSPTTSPVASPPQTDAPAPGPSTGLTPTSAPAPGPDTAADAPGSAAWANKAFLVGTAFAGALYAVVLA